MPGGGRASDDTPRTDDSTSTDDRTSTGGTPDLGVVLELLRTAPPEVRDWLFAQTVGDPEGAATSDDGAGSEDGAGVEEGARSDDDTEPDAADGTDPEADPAPVREPGASPDPAGPDDDPDPMDEDDADDDILTRRAEEHGKISRSGRWVIALAVVAGVVFGVWYAGRPAAQDEATASTTTPTMSSAVPDEEAEARVEELTAAVEADPEDTSARLELGVLLFNAGQTEAAGEQWLAVTELAPDEQEAWYNLGFYHVSTEPADYDAAGECWARVVEIDPDSELADVASMHLGGVMGSGETTAPGATSSPGGDETSTSG